MKEIENKMVVDSEWEDIETKDTEAQDDYEDFDDGAMDRALAEHYGFD